MSKKRPNTNYFISNEDEDVKPKRRKRRRARRKIAPAKEVKNAPTLRAKKSKDEEDGTKIKVRKPTALIKVRGVDNAIPQKLQLDKSKIRKHSTVEDAEEDFEKENSIASKNASLFARKLAQIKKAQEDGAFPESVMLLVYQGLMDTILDLIPLAEITYRTYKNTQLAYALNTYINQARLVAEDMRSLQDFEEQANKIIKMIREQFTDVVNNMADEAYSLKKFIRETDVSIKTRKRIEERIDRMLSMQGRFLNESSKALGVMISDFMTTRPVTKEATKGALPNG
jgi:hypothetical protein